MVRHFLVLLESDVATLSHHLEFIVVMLDNTMDHMDDLAAGAYVMDASARELRRSLVFGQEYLGQVHRLLSVAIVMPLDVDFAGPTYVSEHTMTGLLESIIGSSSAGEPRVEPEAAPAGWAAASDNGAIESVTVETSDAPASSTELLVPKEGGFEIE